MLQIQNMPLPVEGFPAQLEKRAPSCWASARSSSSPWSWCGCPSTPGRRATSTTFATVRAVVEGEEKLLARCRDKRVSPCLPPRPYVFPAVGRRSTLPPVVAGMGPAGLFAALFLARNGLPPIVAGAGRPVEERTADVEQFWATGVLIPPPTCSSERGARVPSPTAS